MRLRLWGADPIAQICKAQRKAVESGLRTEKSELGAAGEGSRVGWDAEKLLEG